MITKPKPNYKTEVSFIRASVDHWSFVTGLAGRLAGKEGNKEDSSVRVNTIFTVDIFEGYRVKNPMMFTELEVAPYHNVLEGEFFQCCDLLTWIVGTFDSKELKEHKYQNPVTEFTVEKWVVYDEYTHEWQLRSKTHWGGVKWLDAAHTTDGGDRMCAGVATFVCDSKVVEDIENGEKVVVDNKYPRTELRKILRKNLLEPKHPANYMG